MALIKKKKEKIKQTMVLVELKSCSDKWEGTVLYNFETQSLEVNKDDKYYEFESKVLKRESTKVNITIFTGASDPIHLECDLKEKDILN